LVNLIENTYRPRIVIAATNPTSNISVRFKQIVLIATTKLMCAQAKIYGLPAKNIAFDFEGIEIFFERCSPTCDAILTNSGKRAPNLAASLNNFSLISHNSLPFLCVNLMRGFSCSPKRFAKGNQIRRRRPAAAKGQISRLHISSKKRGAKGQGVTQHGFSPYSCGPKARPRRGQPQIPLAPAEPLGPSFPPRHAKCRYGKETRL